ncbi:CAP domain-containing protein [Streptomyces sp. NPDC002577]
MGKHRKKNHYRRITVAAVAVGVVGVPSVAMACNQWPDGSGSDSQNYSAGNTTFFQQRWTDADWERWARSWDREPSSAAPKTSTASPSTTSPSTANSAPKTSAPKSTATASPTALKTTASKAETTTESGTPSATTTSAPKSTATTPTSTTKTTASASDVAARIVELVNNERSKAGCSPLTLNATLTKAAQAHSDDMASHQNMSHTGSDGSDPGQRITQAGYTWSTYGENVAYGYSTPEQVMEGWMSSPGHKANILNCSFKEIGVGLAEPNDYWTQDFGTAR